MQDMSKDGLIPTFDMDTEKCKTCMLTKITKKPFQNVKRETKVLELYVYLLHTKFEALDKFKVFKTEVKLQQGSQIKRFRTGRGGEYMDTQYFQKYSKLKLNYNKGPLIKTIQDWAVVRHFDPKLKTFGKRGIEYIFVGYAEHSNAFRFYAIEPNKSVSNNSIIESRDAIFNENRLSSVPRPSLRIPNGTKDIGGSVVPEEVTEEKSRIDYFDTYAPVARISTIRLMIALQSIHNLIIHQMDVKIAFLNVHVDLTKEFLSSRFSMKDMGEADAILVSTPIDTSEKLMPNNGQAVSQLRF
ncbi:zinc finger, CCHC-type containing protein [Tanacetum coccineum]